MPALALTDRDGLYGAVKHAVACQAAGVAPILGADLARPGGLARPGDLARAGEQAGPGARPGSAMRTPPGSPCSPRARDRRGAGRDGRR